MYNIGDRITFIYKNIERLGYIIEVDTKNKIYKMVTNLPNLISIGEKQIIKLSPRPTMVIKPTSD